LIITINLKGYWESNAVKGEDKETSRKGGGGKKRIRLSLRKKVFGEKRPGLGG